MLTCSPWEKLLLASDALQSGAFKLDQFDPLTRLAKISSSAPSGTIDERLLAILRVLNDLEEVAHDVFVPTHQIYILGIDTTHEISLHTAAPPIPLSEVEHVLGILHSIGLVYRLPAALKFGYDPGQYFQVRISGWGRHYLSQTVEPSKSAKLWIRSVFERHIMEYRQLLAFCRSNERPLAIRDIHALNLSLPIPLVI